ncbi:MAG: tetratricopeptide repeat protein, partial [Spirochaetaceae bacterium]|nr:tetratricopeptide repeat protein [Spirochaetaceae bacterium]
EGFVFATVKTFQEWDLLSDKAKPIRRLNALGEDILVKNATVPPIGDLNWGNAAGIRGAAKFADITVLDNEVYIAIDENRGRLFGYNNQGYLLFAFGGKGNIEGYFRTPTAVEHCGRDLFILDAQSCALTVYTPTEFGNLIYDATEQYACGEYDEAAVTWQKVLDLNGNYDLAYIGLGKALVRQKRYKEAMTYFKLKHDRKDYSKAFMYYRKEVVEKNVGYVVFIAAALLVVCFAIKRISKIKKELEAE